MELFGDPLLVNQDFQQEDIFGGFSYQWDSDVASCSTAPYATTSGVPVSVIGHQSSAVENVAQTNKESTSNTEVGNEQADFQTWYSEFEEMKNAERKKVNMISVDREKKHYIEVYCVKYNFVTVNIYICTFRIILSRQTTRCYR